MAAVLSFTIATRVLVPVSDELESKKARRPVVKVSLSIKKAFPVVVVC